MPRTLRNFFMIQGVWFNVEGGNPNLLTTPPKYGKQDAGEINKGISEELYIRSLIWQGKGRQ